jgi:DNA-directed RNA polymerase subunit K/omega
MDDEEYSEVLEDGEYDILETDITSKKPVDDIHEFMEHYEEHKKNYNTSNVLSKYEKTRILSERAQQIEDGSHPYISDISRFDTAYRIAVEELNTKKIPFIIRRSIPHSLHYEYWKLKDMIF